MNGNYDHELIMTQQEFERTGRQIRVPEDELVSIVLDRIDHYLTLHPRERRNYPDPRRQPVVTRIASGKTIQIPQQIVDKALEIHQACGRIGTVERMESVTSESKVGKHSDMASAHTRLAKRERYSQGDPFIMNQDLRGHALVGRDGEIAGDPTFRDYPRRYRDFNRSISEKMSRDSLASDLDDKANPLNSYLHSRSAAAEARSRADVGSFRIGQRSLAHKGGPRNDKDYMEEVSGIDSDISPESGSASVYAPLDDHEDHKSNGEQHQNVMRPDINMDDYDGEADYNCGSCGHNDGYRGNYPYHPRMHPTEIDNDGHFDHRNYSDEYPSMGEENEYVPEPGYDEINEQDMSDIDDDEYYNSDELPSVEEMIEKYSNSKNGSYNYVLWLLLIILVIILVMNYRKTQSTASQ